MKSYDIFTHYCNTDYQNITDEEAKTICKDHDIDELEAW